MRSTTDCERKIQVLGEAVEAFGEYSALQGEGDVKDLFRSAQLLARGYRVDRTLDAVEETLRDEATTPDDAGLARLEALGGEPWVELGGWRETRWVAASVEAAWRRGLSAPVQALLRTAATCAAGQSRRQCAAVVRELVSARSLKAEGAHPAAIAACEEAVRLATGSPHLEALALETKADTFGEIGDPAGEAASLLEEDRVFATLPGGMVGEAGRQDAMSRVVGPSSKRRTGELLAHASRLAVLLTKAGDTVGARRVLEQFRRCGRREWVDPARPELGSVEERLQRLDTRSKVPYEGKTPITVHEPERGYAGLDFESVERVLREVEASEAGSVHLIVLAEVPCREMRFCFDPSLGTADAQLAGRLGVVMAEPDCASLGLRVWPARAKSRGAGKGSDWLVVEHGSPESPVAGLVFGVCLSILGSEVQVSLYAALAGLSRDVQALAEALRGGLARDLAAIPGYETLKDRVNGALAVAGRTLSSRAEARRDDGIEDP